MEKESGKTLSLLKNLLRDMVLHRRLLLIIALTIIGSTLASLAAPYILGIVIDHYIVPGRYEGLPLMAFLYFMALSGQWLFTTLRSYYIQAFGQLFLYTIRQKLFHKLLNMRISFYARRQIGDLVSRLINDTTTLNEVLVSGMLTVLSDVLSLIGIILVMVMLSPSLTIAALSTIPLMVFIAKYFGGKLRIAYRATRESIAEISSVVEESITGIETIKALAREKEVLKDYDRALRKTIKSYMRIALLMGVFWPLMNISSMLSIAMVLVYGGYLVLVGATSIGVVVAFIQYVQRLVEPVNNIVSMYDALQSALASLERIYEVLESNEIEVDEGLEAKRLRGAIRYEDVWFEYEPGKPVLKGINLEIKPGEIVALVGHTGAGKTTMVNLLLRFYEPTKGRILVDGIDVRKLRRRWLRERISYVPQETYLFPGTIMDNIRIAKPDASDEEVMRICKELGIHELIEKLPEGYNTDAGEAGKRLSLGERQLLAIARAMLKDPDIVVLDEALSSVDPETEAMIRKAIRKLMKGRTGIIIAHRLSIVHDVDRIVVIDNGEIREEGRLEELLAKHGLFYKLYTSQMEELTIPVHGVSGSPAKALKVKDLK